MAYQTHAEMVWRVKERARIRRNHKYNVAESAT